MCTVLVSYEPSNKMAVQAMNLLSMVKGVKIDEDAILTEEEVMKIVKAKKSGTYKDIDVLLNYLKSKV